MTATNGRGYAVRKYIEVCLAHLATGRPVIDSVLAGSSRMAADTTKVLSYANLIIDSLPLAVMARGLNNREILSYQWTAKTAANIFTYPLLSAKNAYYRYPGSDRRDTSFVANAATVIDTVTVTVTRVTGDKSHQSIALIKIPKRYNKTPFFDSIVVADTTFKGSDSLYDYEKAMALDTVHFTFDVGDSDATDSLFFSWSAIDTAGLQSPVKVNKNLFRGTFCCRDTSYTDTITATVRDQWQASRSKMLYITVTK
jgi:hypothetical protein